MSKKKELEKNMDNAFNKFIETLTIEQIPLFRKYLTTRHLLDLENIRDIGK